LRGRGGRALDHDHPGQGDRLRGRGCRPS
jgi:hypothetical protein